MAKKSTSEKAVSFEQAMSRLDEIVEEMENAELPLEELLQRYEEGTRLRAFCEQKLAEAEQRVERLKPSASGAPILEPFDPATAVETASAGDKRRSTAPSIEVEEEDDSDEETDDGPLLL